jgi:hypothetical protein
MLSGDFKIVDLECKSIFVLVSKKGVSPYKLVALYGILVLNKLVGIKSLTPTLSYYN